MRVLLVIDDTDLPAARDVSQRRWIPLVRRLHEARVDVAFATLREQWELEIPGVESLGLGLGSTAGVPWAARRLRKVLTSGGFDVAQAHEVIPSIVLGSAAIGRRRPVTVFFREHTFGSKKLAAASFLATRLCDLVFAPSQAVGDYARRDSRVGPRRFRAAHNGVFPMDPPAPEALERRRASLGISADAHVVTFVGRLREEKGMSELLTAMDLVAERVHRPLHLIVAGAGPDEAELIRRAATVRSFETHFLGHRDDVAEWYAVGDVVAVPSRRESFGLTAAEAMAARRAVVAFDVGGLSEIVIDGVTGRLVRPGDLGAFAAAAAELLVDDELRDAMGTAGHERYSERFTIGSMVGRWIDLWREVSSSESLWR